MESSADTQLNVGTTGWDLLVQKAAHTALYDSAARFNPPACDEDTRVELLGRVMSWIQNFTDPIRLLYMTGPAGAGKSAIQQTVAQQCASMHILAASFFFAAADDLAHSDAQGITPSMTQDALAVPATIAYQLACASPDILRPAIAEIVERDPLVFNRTVESQMRALIVDPVNQHRAALETTAFPHVILIDGLDECMHEGRQAELLVAIERCLLREDLPFRLFLASRPELVFYDALSPSGHLHDIAYHLQLDERWKPDLDLRIFFEKRFHEISRSSKDSRTRVGAWPGEEALVELVRRASGQFIYAATVIRYISNPRSSPIDRLRSILQKTPLPGSAPLAVLYALYDQLLEKAEANFKSTNGLDRDLIICLATALGPSARRNMAYDRILFPGGLDMLTIDLRSVAEVRAVDRWYPGTSSEPHTSKYVLCAAMRLHHRTFSEFLFERMVERESSKAYDRTVAVGAYVVRMSIAKIMSLLDNYGE